jgi:hypothetical protein
MLSMYSTGGMFKVFARDKPEGTHGVNAVVMIGKPSTQAAIGALPGMPFMAGQDVQGYIASQVQSAVKEEQYKRRIEDLEAAIDSPSTMFDKAIDFCERLGIDGNLITSVLMNKAAPRVAAPIAGGPTPPAPVPTDQPDAIDVSVERMYKVFGEETPTIFVKLADWVESNPAQAQALINGL